MSSRVSFENGRAVLSPLRFHYDTPDFWLPVRLGLLSSQGPGAPGGAYDYLVKGRLFGGFAVVAWPASYRNSGVKTFLANHDGVVYERDLGSGTAKAAAG